MRLKGSPNRSWGLVICAGVAAGTLPFATIASANPVQSGHLVGWGLISQHNSPAGNNYVAVSSGGEADLALTTTGTIASWGINSYGQVSGAPTGSGYTAISAGSYADLALTFLPAALLGGAITVMGR